MDIWFTLFVTIAALLAAIGFSLLMIGYINSTLASFQYGWRNWGLVLALPFVGGVVFCYRHKDDHLKTGRQLLFGILSILGSLGMIYGAGPSMIRHVGENMKAEMSASPATPAASLPEGSLANPATKP
jgi:hypothetical protein